VVLALEESARSRRRTSSQRKPRNWIRSRRTIRPKSRGQRTPLPDQCSTGPALAAVGSGLVWAEGSAPELAARESAAVSAARESAPELVPEWAAGSGRQAAQ